MIVIEYESKFRKLLRFTPHQVLIEERKANRFEKGLKCWLYKLVASFELNNYVELVHKAVVIEKEI